MPIEKRDINTLTPYANNPRTHPDGQVTKLASLMKRYGFHDSHAIAVDESGEIIWGHGRLEAAKEAGLTEVPVEVLTGLTEEDKQALRIADNAIAEQSDWNMELLQQELQKLDDANYQLEYLALDEDLLVELGSGYIGGSVPDDGEWENGMSGVPDGDKTPFRQMTFTLHDSQFERVEKAIGLAKSLGGLSSENQNSNGNALDKICEFFLLGNDG